MSSCNPDCKTECDPLDETDQGSFIATTKPENPGEDCIRPLSPLGGENNLLFVQNITHQGPPNPPLLDLDLLDGSQDNEIVVGGDESFVREQPSIPSVLSNPAGKLTSHFPSFVRGDFDAIINKNSGLTRRVGSLPGIFLASDIPDYDATVFEFNGEEVEFSSQDLFAVGADKIDGICNPTCNIRLMKVVNGFVPEPPPPDPLPMALFSFSTEGDNPLQFEGEEGSVSYHTEVIIPKEIGEMTGEYPQSDYGCRYLTSHNRYIYFRGINIDDVIYIQCVSSSDLINWSVLSTVFSFPLPESQSWDWPEGVQWDYNDSIIVLPGNFGPAYADGPFIPPAFYYSTDGGVTWTPSYAPEVSTIWESFDIPSYSFVAVAYSAPLFKWSAVVKTYQGFNGPNNYRLRFYSSMDGIDWNAQDSYTDIRVSNNYGSQIFWSNNKQMFFSVSNIFVDTSSITYVFSSSNGDDWDEIGDLPGVPRSQLIDSDDGRVLISSMTDSDNTSDSIRAWEVFDDSVENILGGGSNLGGSNSFRRFCMMSYNPVTDRIVGCVFDSGVLFYNHAIWYYNYINDNRTPRFKLQRHDPDESIIPVFVPTFNLSRDSSSLFIGFNTNKIYELQLTEALHYFGFSGIPSESGDAKFASAWLPQQEDFFYDQYAGYGYFQYLVSDDPTPKGRKSVSLRNITTAPLPDFPNPGTLGGSASYYNNPFEQPSTTYASDLLNIESDGLSVFAVYKINDTESFNNFDIMRFVDPSGDFSETIGTMIRRTSTGYSIRLTVNSITVPNSVSPGWYVESFHIKHVSSNTIYNVRVRSNMEDISDEERSISFAYDIYNPFISIACEGITRTSDQILSTPCVEFCQIAAFTHIDDEAMILQIENTLKNYWF